MIESHTTSVPTRESQLANAVDEFMACQRAGEQPRVEDFAGRFPDLAEDLNRLLPALATLGTSEHGSDVIEADIQSGVLGDFRLIREVGRGGMGVVYEAEQLSLSRRVALKVLPFAATMDSRHLQRFKNEALAAASLEHPHIVPVYGVGCERGVHYYAMKLIDGQSLAELNSELRKERQTDHDDTDTKLKGPTRTHSSLCSLSRRGKERFRGIAQLVAQAADALEYAHSMGVVHRDIKPANLMLDDNGHLWVTDFGLAKLETNAGMTMTGDLIGTLRYMSPEQALAKHGLVDHRTDVYSLGATLYELLTLRPAVDGADKQEVLTNIAFAEPTVPRKLDKSIPAELETITLKCLAKEPTERYATAGELAEDLRRWLSDQTIKAKPPGWREKAAKWGRRHREYVITGVAILGVSVIALAASTWLVWREKEATARAKQQADIAGQDAREQAAIAKAVNEFLCEDLLQQTDIRQQAQRGFDADPNLTMKVALQRAADRIGKRFGDRPLVEAAVHRAIGDAYHGLGLYELAVKHQSAAVQLFDRHLGVYDLLTCTARFHLAHSCLQAGRPEEALELFEQAAARQAEKLGPNHRQVVASLRGAAWAHCAAGRRDKAVELLRPLLELQTKELGPGDDDTQATLNNLAIALSQSGQAEEALRLLEQQYQQKVKDHGHNHPETLNALANLAQEYQGVGRNAESIRILEPVVEETSRFQGPGHPDTLQIRNNLATAYHKAGRLVDAIRVFEEVRAASIRVNGPAHPITLTAGNNLAGAYTDAGRHEDSIKLFIGLTALAKETWGNEHPYTQSMNYLFAKAYVVAGRLSEAVPRYEQFREWRLRVLGPDHPSTREATSALAYCLMLNRQFDQAAENYRFVVDSQVRTLPADHLGLSNTRHRLGECLLKSGRHAEAEAVLRASLSVSQNKRPADWRTSATQAILGASVLGQERFGEAEPLLIQSFESMLQQEGKIGSRDRLYLTETIERLIDLYEATKRNDKAAEWRKKLDEHRAATGMTQQPRPSQPTGKTP